MIEVHASVHIDRPVEDVFVFLSDVRNNPRWQRGMSSCEWTTDPPIRVGSTYHQEASFMGKEITSDFEVIEFVPGHRVRIQTTGGTMSIDVTRSTEAVPSGGTAVEAVVRGDSSGVFRIADPLMKRLVGRSVRRDYARLKELLETGH